MGVAGGARGWQAGRAAAGLAEAAEEVPGSLCPGWPRTRSGLEFGLKVYAEVNWWFFAKSGIPGCRLDAAAGFIEVDFTHSGSTTVISY